MALKLQHAYTFSIFDPNPNPNPNPRPSLELRFSRSNNAKPHPETRVRSPNVNRSPRPSRPGKYSKNLSKPVVDPQSHPAFRFSNIPKSRPRPVNGAPENVKISEDGLSYVIEGAPFEFKYSYTETPKVKPIKMREEPFVPFGPTTMPRPWTGRAPIPPSKKKLKEFDSFVLPPPHKKGVKPVQSPGPFLPGTSPRYVKTREEILGEPLTPEEIDGLVKSCIKTQRQLHIGRDGLTHNMLDNIHAHWKRRRVCKIKCLGVCTVDMDNVCQQLEERTGGKIIHRKGGVLYLFRGRNYNYRTRPHFPLMLWKPVPPVYPRLIQRVPEGLTLEEATEMRQKGSTLIPICKLGKNGVYYNLANDVREAFEECELVRINCQGLNRSDYRKIGAKLRDLVPCTLLSFENEHILMWRGPNWKSSLPDLRDDCKANKIQVEDKNYETQPSEALEFSEPCLQKNPVELASTLSRDGISSGYGDGTLDEVEVPYPNENSKQSISVVTEIASPAKNYETHPSEALEFPEPCLQKNPVELASTLSQDGISSGYSDVTLDEVEVPYPNENSKQSMSVVTEIASPAKTYEIERTNNATGYGEPEPYTCIASSMTMSNHAECSSNAMSDSHGAEGVMDSKSCSHDLSASILGSGAMVGINGMDDTCADKLLDGSGAADVSQPSKSAAPCMKEILLLLEQAVEKGSAVVLDEDSLDADNIFQTTVAFAESAPPGPVFRKHGKVVAKKSDKQEGPTLETKKTTTVSMKGKKEKSTKIPRKDNYHDQLLNVVPQGTLGVDELAKLLT